MLARRSFRSCVTALLRGSSVSSTAAAPPDRTLVRLGGTPPIGEYLGALWRRREFAWDTARGELRAQHLDTALGNLWHLVNPLMLIGVYYLVFGLILNTTRGVENFIAFLAIGVFTFQFSQKAALGGARTIVSNVGLIRSLQFPRVLLPIATVLRETMAYATAALIMFAVVLFTGEPVSVGWLLVPVAFVLQFGFNTGLALVGARLSDKFRDLVNVLPYLFRIAFYLSGVLYAADRYVDDPLLLRIFLFNPFYVFVSLPREYLLASQDHAFIGWMWVSAGTWSVAGLLLGLIIFRSGEKDYGRG
jgi:teichoic acid transport system permease protein